MRIKAQLLALAAAYCQAKGITDFRLSSEMYGTGDRLARLRRGKDMLSENVENGIAWICERWPEGEPWPCDVPRPAAPPSAPSPSSAAPAGPPV